MRALTLCLVCAILLSGCFNTSGKKNPERKKEIAAWTDSLLNAVSEVSLYPDGLPKMSLSQKRMPEKYHLEKSVKMHLVGDSLRMEYKTLAISEIGEQLKDIEDGVFPFLHEEYGIAKDIPVSIFLGIESENTMENVVAAVNELTKCGYTQICFGGLVTDQPDRPSIPNEEYYKEIQDKLAEVPSAALPAEYGQLADKETRKCKAARPIMDDLFKIPNLYLKLKHECENYPEALQSYKKSDRILTLMYYMVDPWGTPDRINTAVRAFTFSEDGKAITVRKEEKWGKIASEIFDVKEKSIAFSMQ